MELKSLKPYGTIGAFIAGNIIGALSIACIVPAIIFLFKFKAFYSAIFIGTAILLYFIYRFIDLRYEWHQDAKLSCTEYGIRYEYRMVTFKMPAVYVIKEIERIESKKNMLVVYGRISYKNPSGAYAAVMVKKCKIAGRYDKNTFKHIQEYLMLNVPAAH